MGPAKPTHGGLHLSATRVDTFDHCNRKWGYEYLDGLPNNSFDAPHFRIGTAVHAWLERYFRYGRLPWLGRRTGMLAAGTLRHWRPYAKGRYLPEMGFSTPIKGKGVEGLFTGTSDLVIPDVQGIGDHKTTVDLEKWAPTPDTLRTWPQPRAYGYNVARLMGWTGNVQFQWLYVEKGSGRTKPVKMSMSTDELAEGWSHVEHSSLKMLKIYDQKPKAEELSGASDTNYCNAYGGCPFKQVCPSYASNHSTSLFGDFDGENEMPKNELDELLGTDSEAREADEATDVGDTTTDEDGADIDALFNPPARTGTAAVTSKAPPIVDATASTETKAKAKAEQAAKPSKAAKVKPTGAKRSVIVDVKADMKPEGAAALEAATQARTETAKVETTPSPPAAQPVPPPMAPQPAVPEWVGTALMALVRIYLTGELGENFEHISAIVKKLEEKHKGNDQAIIVLGAQTIGNLRTAFGE